MPNPHEIRTMRCAHCGTVRREANHWFGIVIAGSGFHCAPFLFETIQCGERPVMSLRKLRKEEQPVCGQQCAQKIFEKYLTQQGTGRLSTAKGIPLKAQMRQM